MSKGGSSGLDALSDYWRVFAGDFGGVEKQIGRFTGQHDAALAAKKAAEELDAEIIERKKRDVQLADADRARDISASTAAEGINYADALGGTDKLGKGRRPQRRGRSGSEASARSKSILG